MGNIYVRSLAGGTASGADWANAKLTLTAGLAIAVAGDDIWVSEDHAESTAGAVTLQPPGTAASPNRILCVNHAGSVPPVSADLRTTATVATTISNALTVNGSGTTVGVSYWYGIGFTAGSSTGTPVLQVGGNTGACAMRFEACSFALGGSNAGGLIKVGADVVTNSPGPDEITWFNCTVSFANAGQSIDTLLCRFRWYATASAVAGTAPTTLFTTRTQRQNAGWVIRGVDLSALGSGKNLVSVTGGGSYSFLFEDCKLGASVSVTTGTNAGIGGPEVALVNCDSGATNYRFAKANYAGTETQETTVVRSGGATDGTTAVSRKLVSTANSKFYFPYESEYFYIWNDTTGGAKTVTVYTVTDNVTLTNADIWLELEYLGSSLTPLGTLDLSNKAADVLAVGSNQTTDTSTWTTTGLGTPVKQKLAATVTPNMKGLFKCRVCLAKASTTVYVDPLPVVTP